MDGIAMRSRQARQVGFHLELETRAQDLGMAIGGRSIITMIDPQHRYVGLHLHREMKDRRLIRTEVG